jgi:REP element-mobilizing transposase RayT
LAAGGMPDHIHLLVSLSREIAVAELVRTIKAASSKWVHDHVVLRDFRLEPDRLGELSRSQRLYSVF